MKSILLKEKYPIYTLEIFKNEIKYKDINSIIKFLKNKIEENPVATFIAEFDQLAHSRANNGTAQEGMINAKNIIFCLGIDIPSSKVMAVKPRAIGISEFEEHFELGILEVPNEEGHITLQNWIKDIQN